MKTLIFTAAAIVAIYTIAMIIKNHGIPTSISDTHYLNKRHLFTFVMWATALLFGTGAAPLTPSPWTFLAFLTSAGLMFVGAACQCRDSIQAPVHYGGAFTFAIASQAWVAVVASPLILLTFVTASGYLWSKNRIFWAEINCIVNLVIATAMA